MLVINWAHEWPRDVPSFTRTRSSIVACSIRPPWLLSDLAPAWGLGTHEFEHKKIILFVYSLAHQIHDQFIPASRGTEESAS